MLDFNKLEELGKDAGILLPVFATTNDGSASFQDSAGMFIYDEGGHTTEQAIYIIALLNAAPEMFSLVRRQEAELAAARASMPAAGAQEQVAPPVTPKHIEEIKDLLLWPVTEDDARVARDMLQSIHFDLSMQEGASAAQPAAAAPDAQADNWKGKLYAAMDAAFELHANGPRDADGQRQGMRIDDTQIGVEFAMNWFEKFATPALASAQPEAKATPDLCYVIHWLEGGCDPLEAARELRAYQKQMGQAPAAALESKAAPAPATLSDAQIDQMLDNILTNAGTRLKYYTLPKSIDGMRAALRSALAAAGNSQGLDGRSTLLDELLERFEKIRDQCSEYNAGRWPEMQSSAESGVDECLAVLRELKAPSAPVGGSHG